MILVDNSNIFIEGAKYSAQQKGVTGKVRGKDPVDPSWRINFGSLVACLAESRTIHAAILVGSSPPPNDSVWEAAQANGFEVVVYARDSNNREKAVDTEFVAQGTEIIVSATNPMDLVIASGDRDFIPLVKVAHRRQWEVEMCAFTSAYNVTGEMVNAVDRVRPLDSSFSIISRYDFNWP